MENKTTAITDSHPIDNILSSLENVIETQKYQYRAKCPVHQKANSSSRTLSIKEETDAFSLELLRLILPRNHNHRNSAEAHCHQLLP